MTPQQSALLLAASQINIATGDIIEAELYGIARYDNVLSGETLSYLADGMRLLIEAMGSDREDVTQLHGAVVRYLEDAE